MKERMNGKHNIRKGVTSPPTRKGATILKKAKTENELTITWKEGEKEERR